VEPALEVVPPVQAMQAAVLEAPVLGLAVLIGQGVATLARAVVPAAGLKAQ
jgi:hypothetical protein